MTNIVYSDTVTSVSLHQTPLCKGHLSIRPETNNISFNTLTTEENELLFYTASYASTAVFELLKAQGTNIIINDDSTNGFEGHIIPRWENDNLSIGLKPQQKNPEEIKDVASSIKDAIDYEVWAFNNPEEAKKANDPVPKQNVETISDTSTSDDDENEDSTSEKSTNYLLRSLDRVP